MMTWEAIRFYKKVDSVGIDEKMGSEYYIEFY